jgi:hypothetical protein
MKLRRSHLGLFLAVGCSTALAGAAAAAAKPSGTPPLSPRFQQVRDRIEALFGDRSAPATAPTLVENPFRPPGALARRDATADDPDAPLSPAAVSSDLDTLQQAVATLRVTGIFEVAGVVHLVINARPYKNGDVLQVTVGNETIYLRIRDVARNLVTLALNDAEMTLKY